MIIGIDPGVNGGAAIMTNVNQIYKLYSFSNKTEYDIKEFFDGLGVFDCTAYLEKVHSAPGQGVKSMFTFGQAYGFIRGLVIAHSIPLVDITPQEWQRILKIPKKANTYAERKKLLKSIAQQLYPSNAKEINNSTADALLIARAGAIIHSYSMDI